jgi:exodeoxyribonuclease V alpha subunit
MEFRGAWTIDHKKGRQFKTAEAIEKMPATTASIETYLGSGLITGKKPVFATPLNKYFSLAISNFLSFFSYPKIKP